MIRTTLHWTAIPRALVFLALTCATLLGSGCGGREERAGSRQAPARHTLTISAAASLKDAFDEIEREMKQHDSLLTVTINYGASNLLARQIQEGAPVDLFASAAEDVIDSLEKRGMIAPDSRRIFARNGLVVIGPAGAVPIASLDRLTDASYKRIAIASPGVPARLYGEEALRAARLWEKLSDRFVFGGNVRQVLDYVAKGEADAGIVYASDVEAAKGAAAVILAIPDSLHRPILYPIAVPTATKNRAAADAFIATLTGATGRAALAKHGFLPADSGG